MEWPKITLFGDSITRFAMNSETGCWASMIANEVGSFLDVDLRGFSGYNSKWALELVPRLFPKSYLDKVEIFVIFFGHNDSWESTSPQHIPLADYSSNMRNIIDYLIKNGLEKRKIIMITPTWYDAETWTKCREQLGKPLKGKTYEEANSYSDATIRIASEEGIDVIDFFTKSVEYSPLAELFCDGLHYSKIGGKLLFDNIMPLIKNKLETKFERPLVNLWHVKPADQLIEELQGNLLAN